MKANLIEMRGRARRYWALLRWMVRDAATHFSGAMALALAASFCGVLMQGGVLGIVLIYARHLETGATLAYGGLALDPRSSMGFLAVGGVAAGILIASAALIYLAKRTIAALSVNYEMLCSRRVLEINGVRPRERLPSQATRKILRALLREQGHHARACGRAFMTVMNAAYPLIILLYMSAFLAYLNPVTTLLLGVVASVFLYAHYRLNVQVAENELLLKRVLPKFNTGVRQLLNALLPLGRVHSDVGARVSAAYADGGVREYFDRVRLRRCFSARADFLGNLLIGVATGGVVIYLGHLALSGALSWGGVISYIVALRIAVSGARSLLNAVAGYARWYPGVRAYRELTGYPPGAAPAGGELRVRNRTGRGDIKEITLHPGDVGAMLSPVEVTRFTLFHFTESLLGEGAGAQWDFVPARPRVPEGVSLRTLLGGAGDFAGLFHGCDDARFTEQMRVLVNGDPDRVLDVDLAQRLDGAQAMKLVLLAMLRREGRGIVISATAWAQLPADEQRGWLHALRGRFVFIHHGKDVTGPGAFGEKVVVIGSRAGQVALATCAWLGKRRQRILDRICVVPREERVGFDVDMSGDEAGFAEGS